MKLKVTQHLHAVMKVKGWTQVRLAEASELPQGRFDKNSRHEDWHVFSIAKALEVEIEELFEIEAAMEEGVECSRLIHIELKPLFGIIIPQTIVRGIPEPKGWTKRNRK
ncbi:hypothetical protein [Bacillus tequilensis]|uniref:hypothetical protein n=1 Tax=Bacillus tequilensis TaxID=227866 RepID=UPI0028166CA6|nr:hypothetical protein [Bacillus tequilensis]